jgi:hypothetical protein
MAQGTIEYLLIIGVFLTITLGAVSIFLGTFSSASQSPELAAVTYKQTIASQTVSLSEAAVDGNGDAIFVLVNNTDYPIRLVGYKVDNNEYDLGTGIRFNPREKKSVFFSNIGQCTGGNSCAYDEIIFRYSPLDSSQVLNSGGTGFVLNKTQKVPWNFAGENGTTMVCVAQGEVLSSCSGNTSFTEDITTTGNVIADGNIQGTYIKGDGSLLTNLPSQTQYWSKTGNVIRPTSGEDINVGGNGGFGSINVYGSPITISSASNGYVDFSYGSGEYSNNCYYWSYRVHAYKTVNSQRVYSYPYEFGNGDNCGYDNQMYNIVTWDSVPDADGYLITRYNGYYWIYWSDYYETTSTSFNDGDGSAWWNTPVPLLPTIAYENSNVISGTNIINGDTTFNNGGVNFNTNKDNGNEDYDLFSYGSDPNWDFSNLPFKITWVNPNNGGPSLKFHDGANNLTPIRANIISDSIVNYGNFYNSGGINMSGIGNGFILVSNNNWLQSANTSGKELFFDRGNGRLGIGTTAPAAAISLATSTTVAGGIKFGSDVELYRSAANVLRTPDAFTADGVITGNGSGLTTLNATNLSSGTVANARMSTTPATYTIDPIMPSSTSVIHNTLSDPTSGELGLANDAYTFDFLRYQLPTTISYTLDGNNWIDFNGNEKYATTTTNVFAGTNNGNLLLKNAANNGGTAYQGLRIDLNYPTWNFYVFLKYIYLYTSTNGHQMSIKIERQKDTNATWDTLFQSANTSSWPGHFFISHSSSPFGPTPASGHWQRFRITFTPVWSGSYPSNNIAIYGLRWYATYPASAGGNTARSLFAGDFNRNFQVFSNLQIGAGDANIYRTGVRTLKTDSNVTVENLITTSGNFAGDISMTTTGTKIGWDSGTEYIRRTLGSDGFSIGTQGADRFVVNALGNVGIGTITPTTNLDLNGSAIIRDDLNIGTKTMIKTDGNLILTSPNGTKWNCGVSDTGVFSCS